MTQKRLGRRLRRAWICLAVGGGILGFLPPLTALIQHPPIV